MSKKHLVKTLGLALVAVLAVGSMAASAAFATPASEFAAEAGTMINTVTFTGTGGPAEFQASGGSQVNCEKSTSSGKILSATEAEVTITYSGKCKLTKTPLKAGEGACTNGARGTEEIKTEKLTITPGVIGGTGTKRGLLIKSSSGTLAKFTCPSPAGTVTVSGEVVCESQGENVNKPLVFEKKGTVACARKGSEAGVQLYTEIEVTVGTKLTKQELSAEAGEGIFKKTEKDVQITTETLTYTANVKQT